MYWRFCMTCFWLNETPPQLPITNFNILLQVLIQVHFWVQANKIFHPQKYNKSAWSAGKPFGLIFWYQSETSVLITSETRREFIRNIFNQCRRLPLVADKDTTVASYGALSTRGALHLGGTCSAPAAWRFLPVTRWSRPWAAVGRLTSGAKNRTSSSRPCTSGCRFCGSCCWSTGCVWWCSSNHPEPSGRRGSSPCERSPGHLC